MPQVSDTLWASVSHTPLSQEFYRAASNLGTAIMEHDVIEDGSKCDVIED